MGFLTATLLFAGSITWFLCAREGQKSGLHRAVVVSILMSLFRRVFMVPFS